MRESTCNPARRRSPLQKRPPIPRPPPASPATPPSMYKCPLTASEIVAHSRETGTYPLLARQMKVQGSVILLALIGKDGIIFRIFA